jgi:hypothetical protein
MPALHPDYPCPVCKKPHALYLPTGTAPDLGRQLYFSCSGICARITIADGWQPVEARPAGALEVIGTELNNRAGS